MRQNVCFKKIPYLSRMKNCSRHANLSVCLFARAITREVPPKSVKISTLYHNFLSDYCRDFSHILHICTRPQSRFSCVSVRPGSFLIMFL